MARAPYQCLILPYIIEEDIVKYGIFLRSDHHFWQFISGGGEDGETPIESAHRECFEEAKIPLNQPLYPMDSKCSIPSDIFSEDCQKNWGDKCYVIPEYTFALPLQKDIIKISHEHTEYKFVEYKEAMSLLKHDSNKTALSELRARINNKDFN